MHSNVWLIAVCAVLVSQVGCDQFTTPRPSLLVYCAASMRRPMEEVAKEYQETRGVQVQLQFGGSQTLLSQLEISRIGDVYLAADASYVDLAREKGLAADAQKVAVMVPVIVVNRLASEHVQGLQDLLRDDMRLALADPNAAAIGRTTRLALSADGYWKDFQRKVEENGVFTPTVNGVANAVMLGSVDAGIVWDAIAAKYPELVMLQVSDFSEARAVVEIAVLKSTKQSELAKDFVDYVTSEEAGRQVFEEYGFEVLERDEEAGDPDA